MEVKKSPFNFFGIVRHFFRNFFYQRVPLQFFDVLQQWMLTNAKGSPRSFFGIVRLFLEFFYQIFFNPQFFDVLQQWVLKNAKGPPFSAPGARAGRYLTCQFCRLGFS